MALEHLVDPPDVSRVNLKTIYHQCHGLVTTTRSSPQCGQIFAEIFQSQRDRAYQRNQPQPSAISARRETASLANSAPAASTTDPNPANVEAVEFF